MLDNVPGITSLASLFVVTQFKLLPEEWSMTDCVMCYLVPETSFLLASLRAKLFADLWAKVEYLHRAHLCSLIKR